MHKLGTFLATFVQLIGWVATAAGAEIVFPQQRAAFFADEPIELAVSGLPAGENATVEATAAGVMPVSLAVVGDGSTVTLALPPNTLAPAEYTLSINGAAAGKLHVSRGLWPSTMLVSQTGKGYRNFVVHNAFGFGLNERGNPELPAAEPRAGSRPMKSYEDQIKADIPSLLYMYWTGYVTHKPWGIHKEWASADMIENMRLFNYHVAQRLRRFDGLFISVGSLDEPGLPWGRTAAGGSASGFTGWNVADWMEERGLLWTNDPGSLGEADFRQYMQLRALMLREAFQQASSDIKEVWPTAVYATDSYAPQAVGDGTDPMNQIANDIPTTHVFADYGIGKQGVLAGMYIEKAHDPTSKIAHAMNGQLFGDRVPQPQTRYAYHLMMNVMLAAGLDSNWWLNHVGMTEADLEAVNEPAARLGPIFVEVAPSDHDVAVLWSTTEIWMRVKGVMRAEASNASGEQKALMVADLPEDAVGEDGKLKYNAYSVGGNYKSEVMTTFMAVNRAGYPAHVLHEDLIPQGNLDNYKVLVMVHQTHDLPAEKRAAIEAWMAKGGTLVQDASCTVKFAGALAVDAPSIVNQGYAWGDKFGWARTAKPEEMREATYHQTNHFMESFSRDAAQAFAANLAKTPARQVMKTDSVELSCERHVGGEAQLLMVVNGYEQLPEIAPSEKYHIWNYAPYQATYSLPTIGQGDEVYLIEGLDWKTVSKVEDPTAPQTKSFEPGEMKLYLVVPRPVAGLAVEAQTANGVLDLTARLNGPGTPWPLQVKVANPAGETIVSLYRSTDAKGEYRESIPLGLNALAGDYAVTVSSPLANLEAKAVYTHTPAAPQATVLADRVRVFDAATIREFLASQPAITIAVADAAHQAMADKLATALQAAGLRAAVKPETEVWRQALYPRVWDPYAPLFTATDEPLKPLPQVQKLDDQGKPVRGEDGKPIMIPGQINLELTVQSDYYETPTYTKPDGQVFAGQPASGTLLTVGDKGYLQIGGQETFYEPGVKLFVGDRNQLTPLNAVRTEAKTTADFRAKWARPWKRIVGHVGGFNLTPQLPEVYAVDEHLILLGDSQTGGTLVRALQASELLPQVVDQNYPGPGKALIQFAWSPFALQKNVIFIGATDEAGLAAGATELLRQAR